MMPLARPGWDAAQDFDAILKVKRSSAARVALTEVQPAVHSSGSRYRACAPDLEDFQAETTSMAQRAALLECFEASRRTKHCKALLAKIRELNPAPECPLCGVDTARTFDHYLPESRFPELVVCAYNLIPACVRCNTARGSRWRSEYGRSTLHLYYDWIRSDHRLLTAEVFVAKGLPAARFRVDAQPDSPGFAGRYARHCDALGLVALFDEKASSMLLDIVDDLRGQGFDPERAKAGLLRTATTRARRRGANHWEAELRRGAAHSDEFILYALAGGGA
jgi:hypothetical protein